MTKAISILRRRQQVTYFHRDKFPLTCNWQKANPSLHCIPLGAVFLYSQLGPQGCLRTGTGWHTVTLGLFSLLSKTHFQSASLPARMTDLFLHSLNFLAGKNVKSVVTVHLFWTCTSHKQII